MRTLGLSVAIGLIFALSGGCNPLEPKAVPPSGHFYLDKTADFKTVGRVLVTELENNNGSSGLGKTLTQSLIDSLDKKHLFTVQPVYHTDPQWVTFNLEQVKTFTPQDMANIRKQLNMDALVYGSITRYRSYPQLLVALNLKMVDLRDGRLLWAIADVWDSTDKQVELRIKEFYENQMRSGFEPMNWQIVLNSPNTFYKYIMYEVTETLPKN